MDPNWFYSTLAQSTAALVGLAGGFLVQRLLAQRSEMAEQRAALRETVESLARELDEARDRAFGVELVTDGALQELADLRREDPDAGFSLHSNYLYTFTHGPGYGDMVPEVPLEQAEGLGEVRDAAHDYARALPHDLPTVFARIKERSLFTPDTPSWLEHQRAIVERSIEPANFWEWVPFQRDIVREQFVMFHVRIRKLGGEFRLFSERLLPASLWSLLLVLLGLLVAGVIAPMFFLTAKAGASKPVLLVFFIPLALGFLAYIAFEFRRIRGAADLTKEHF